MQPRAEVQAFELPTEALPAESVAPINIHDVAAVGVERPGFELIAEQIEIAPREIEERADGRIGLTVVVAEVAFEVALERSDRAAIRSLFPPLRRAECSPRHYK